MSDGNLWLMLLLQAVLIALNAVFASAEIAVISMNESKLEKLAQEGNPQARHLRGLIQDPARFLATIQVAVTLAGFLGSAFAAENFSAPLVTWLLALGVNIPAGTLRTLSVILITLLLSYVTLVFGELVPKRVAMRKPEDLALRITPMVRLISALFAPVVWLLTHSTNLVLRLCGIDPNMEENDVSEEEIRMMVDIGSESGVIDDDEKEMIHNIFELDDKPAEDIMTHRTESCILWIEDSIEQWRAYIDETGHTRYPVCGDDIDDVIGIVNSRDFYRFLLGGGQKSTLRNIIREPYFVPDSMKADELFSRMQQKNTHMVMVMDEYGGFQGVVTQKDLLEEIVGELYSEDEEPEQERDIVKLNDTTWKIRGGAEIEDVEEALGVTFPDGDYNTFAGLVLDAIETLPEDGETVRTKIGRMEIHVTKIAEHRIEEAIVTLPKENPTEE